MFRLMAFWAGFRLWTIIYILLCSCRGFGPFFYILLGSCRGFGPLFYIFLGSFRGFGPLFYILLGSFRGLGLLFYRALAPPLRGSRFPWRGAFVHRFDMSMYVAEVPSIIAKALWLGAAKTTSIRIPHPGPGHKTKGDFTNHGL